MLKKHPVFKPITKLEDLAKKYNVKITYLPKFHCELNPIEGLWCYSKQYVRKRTNQQFDIMIQLISDSREEFLKKFVHMKLWRRFWRVILAYRKNFSFEVILNTYFGGKTKATMQSHTKIHNTAILDDIEPGNNTNAEVEPEDE